MSEFKSWQSYLEFNRAITQRTRYFHDPEVEQFLGAVLATHHSRVETIAAASPLWRAQLGYGLWHLDEAGDQTGEQPVPFPPKRMKPIPGRSPEGRVNPKGIAYLYLATDRDTALAEVRPWIGSLISVGKFRVKRDLTIVNCTTDEKSRRLFTQEPAAQQRETAVWYDIDEAFARPVDLSDDGADYVPTQVLAELFKVNGYDGVAYRSSLGKGHNIALFDLNMADLVHRNRMLFEVKCISFDFHEVGNPCSA
ncbi:MAG: RES family NAD+ phosphorylase [Planctomycetota bacterium]|nr:RES family NAD+ phosphorylase [Planctomycetota bacterium]